MPGTPSTKWSLPTMAGTDIANTIDEWTVAAMGAIDSKLAPSDQGAFASRPVSTVGSPGKSGRTYFATDTGVLYRDNGTGWDTALTGVGHAALLGLTADGVTRRGKSIISGAEPRTNAAYGLMPTPDRVQNVVLPADGLITVGYQATWQESVTGAALAAIFIGGNQLKVIQNAGDVAPPVQEVGLAALNSSNAASPNTDRPLFTTPIGLACIRSGPSVGTSYAGDVTTGQILGAAVSPGSGDVQVPFAGFAAVFAAAGTYDISVQFKASSGSVTVKNRKLWVWTVGF